MIKMQFLYLINVLTLYEFASSQLPYIDTEYILVFMTQDNQSPAHILIPK